MLRSGDFIMSEQQGWIKLHRKLLENPISRNPAWFSVWVHILLLASHDESSFIWNSKKTILHSGQFLTGRKKLAHECGVSEGLVEKILNYLESEQQIRQQKTTKYRIITILNWSKYQNRDNKSNNSVTTTRQQRDTFKNDKNEKKEDSLKGNENTQDIKTLLTKYRPSSMKPLSN